MKIRAYRVLNTGYRTVVFGYRNSSRIEQLEHRYIVEKFLGRKLKPGEIVHHKNHNRLDNRIQNLEVISSHSQHLKDHQSKTVKKACVYCGNVFNAKILMRGAHHHKHCSMRCKRDHYNLKRRLARANSSRCTAT